jgi:hypothetical protein
MIRRKNNVVITTTVPMEIYTAAKAGKITFSSLIIDGWNHRQNTPGLLSRINEQEEKTARLAVLLERTQKELWDQQRRKP